MGFKPIKALIKFTDEVADYLHKYIAYLIQYRLFYLMLVKTEYKGKFKSTVLGYFWHLLNPLSQIIIYYLIFTVIFGRGIPNYWAYVSTGMFAFTFFLTSTSGLSNIIIGNTKIVTKMAMPREILVFSKVSVNLITLSISYIILLILMLFFGVKLTIYVVELPIIIVSLVLFSTGIGLILSSITVYLRDVANAANIVFGCMMFAVPVFYLAKDRSTPLMELFWSINPLYHYIEAIHNVFYWGIPMDVQQLFVCLTISPLIFIIGLIIFKKIEKGFAERL